MSKVRVPDLQVVFQPDASFLVKSMTRGVGARVPMQAVGVLSLCGTPRTSDEIAAMLGERSRALFDGLADAGLLVDPAEAAAAVELLLVDPLDTHGLVEARHHFALVAAVKQAEPEHRRGEQRVAPRCSSRAGGHAANDTRSANV